jgi:hypothetical protein
MSKVSVYVDLDGREICLGHLDAEERKLLARLRRRAESHPDWCDFDNYRFRVITEFYDARRVPRKLSRQSVVYRVAQDLSSRLGMAQGLIRPDDYLGDLEELARRKFPSQRAFCDAGGIAPDMLSHVLAGRKELSLGALTTALERIGYRLRIVPVAEVKTAAKKQTG